MRVPEGVALSHEVAAQLVREAQAARPSECCGVLFGRNGIVQRAQPVPNIADDPRTGFYMDEAGLAAALLGGEPLLGFYHSHPKSDPLPSPADLQAAVYPDAIHLIIGLRGEPRLGAWHIVKGSPARLPLMIGETLHASENTADAAHAPASQIAILITAVLAALMTVLIALSLLPPAPPIPGR